MTHSITINPSSKTIEVIKEMIHRKDEHKKIIVNIMKDLGGIGKGSDTLIGDTEWQYQKTKKSSLGIVKVKQKYERN